MRCLGKLPARHDKRTLKLARYLTDDLAPPPLSVDWGAKLANLGPMLNDQLGDCTCAALGHIIEVWTSMNGNQVTLHDSAILKAYQEACGYDPGDPATDRGGIMLDVLNYFRTVGVGGHRARAFVYVDPTNREHVKQAIHLFGGLYVGLGLPTTADKQERWHVVLGGTEQGGNNNDADPGSWGGHAINVCGYGPRGLQCVTWGEKKDMSWDFFQGYTDEAYAILSADWADADGAPSGFDMARLSDDLQKVSL